MRIYRKFALFMFFLTISLSVITFANALGSCCYNTEAGIYERLTSDTCDSGDIRVGSPINDPNPAKRICNGYKQEQVGCLLSSGICDLTPEGNFLYDLDVVKSFLATENNLDVNSVCQELIPKTDSRYSICTQANSIITGSSSSSGSSSASGTGTGTSVGTNTSFGSTSSNSQTVNLCSDGGGLYGFYVSKESCETIDLPGENSCIFNPYLGGQFNSFYTNYADLGLNYFENSCIPKSQITQCYDYKTEENCNNNRAHITSNNFYLNDGCKWIPTSYYSGTIFDQKGGICIAESIEPNKYYDKYYYSFRKNLISNPSFETGFTSWQIDNSSLLVSDENAYQGNSYIILNSGESISQTISHVSQDVVFTAFAYIKLSKVSSSNTNLKLTISSVDNEILTVKTITSDILEDTFSQNYNVFKKVNFGQIILSDNIDESAITFTITANGGEFALDAISFEAFPDTGVISDTSTIFTPLEIISSEASRCGLCYDELKISICSAEKSNLLGDCSYMVENSGSSYSSNFENYLGKYENSYSLDNPWKSQSINNANLFCEMYIQEDQCLDPSNYVNSKYSSLHPFSASQICKWEDTIGCYKDSNNDNYPDTIWDMPNIRVLSSTFETLGNDLGNNYLFNEPVSLSSYPWVGFDTELVSDFALSCDTIPPNSYIYFTAVNSTGDEVLITTDYNDTIGNLMINLDVSDSFVSACKPFTDIKRLFLDIQVNSNQINKYFESNQISLQISTNDYFVDDSGNLIISDGTNDISILTFDQSGNLAKEKSLTLDIDARAPEITLLSPLNIESTYLGPSTQFEFEITDYTGVSYCSYEVTPYFADSIDESFYESSGDFEFESGSKSVNYTLPLSSIIYNSSSNGDIYLFTLDCSDRFNQINTKEYILTVDYNTDVLVLDPIGFRDYNLDTGYLNSSQIFIAVSSDYALNSCQLEFDTLNSNSNLDLTRIDDGFTIDLSGYDSVTFFNNITGQIGFDSDGKKEGRIVCLDTGANTYEKSLIYYYDTKSPIIENFSLDGVTLASGKKTVVKVDENYYTFSPSPGKFNISINGTGSWISNYLEVLFENESGPIDNLVPNFNSLGTSLQNDSFIGNLIFPINMQSYLPVYGGLETNERNLYELRFNIKFADKAQNYKLDTINYYYDTSVPQFKFGADIIDMNPKDSDLYTSSKNPQFEITFNTPQYRTFNCNISAQRGLAKFTKPFYNSNKLEFELKDIGDLLEVTNDVSVPLTLKCADLYGIVLQDSFTLYYDNTEPVLRQIILDNGNEKYFQNYENVEFRDIEDSVVFDLANTNEKNYICNYKFESNEYYTCNESWNEIEFSSPGFQKTHILPIINGGGLDSTSLSSPLCWRTEKFDADQRVAIENGLPFETEIILKGICSDMVNFTTEPKQSRILLNYVTTELAGFELDYDKSKAYPTITSFVPFNTVLVSFEFGGTPTLLSLSNPTLIDDVYVYTSQEGIDTSLFADGTNVIYALAVDSSGTIEDRIAKNIIIDNEAPQAELFIPDENNGLIYTEQFELLYNAKDLRGKLDKIEVYLGDTLLYTTENLGANVSYPQSLIGEPQESLNLFSYDMKSFEGQLTFTGGVIGQRYTFILKAYDQGGNINETSVTISIKDGVGITLLDSSNAFADPRKFSWISNNNAPILKLKTSKIVPSCTLYPYIDNDWMSISNQLDIRDTSLNPVERNSDEFTFDLSSVDFFDMNKIEDRQSFIKIVCTYNGTVYNYTRSLRYVDYLPDYVLESSEGFVFNENPFATTISVKSVGPYRYVTCEYNVDNGQFISFGTTPGINFRESLDLASYSDGQHTIYLQCSDIVGNIGPLKEYNFAIDKNSGLQIEDISLSKGNSIFKPIDNKIYINSISDLDLSFKLNKKSGVGCTYIINPSNSLIDGVINFFTDLFSLSQEDMSSTSAYEFKAEGLDFYEDKTILRIECEAAGNKGNTLNEFEVYYNNNDLDISVQRTSN